MKNKMFQITDRMKEFFSQQLKGFTPQCATVGGYTFNNISGCSYCSGCGNNCTGSCAGSCRGNCTGSCQHYSR